MSVRDAGAKPGLDSSTRTRRPPCATLAAVKSPAAEPPTIITSPSARAKRESRSGIATVSDLPSRRAFGTRRRRVAASNLKWLRSANPARGCAGERRLRQYSECPVGYKARGQDFCRARADRAERIARNNRLFRPCHRCVPRAAQPDGGGAGNRK